MKDTTQNLVLSVETGKIWGSPLFKREIGIVGSVMVTKPDRLLDIISTGDSGYHFLDRYAERMVLIKNK